MSGKSASSCFSFQIEGNQPKKTKIEWLDVSWFFQVARWLPWWDPPVPGRRHRRPDPWCVQRRPTCAVEWGQGSRPVTWYEVTIYEGHITFCEWDVTWDYLGTNFYELWVKIEHLAWWSCKSHCLMFIFFFCGYVMYLFIQFTSILFPHCLSCGISSARIWTNYETNPICTRDLPI